MYLALNDAQLALQAELRTYFADLAATTPGPGGRPDYVATIRRMGDDGWLGIGWPVEYGGHARGPIDQMIFVEESHWAGVPLPLLTLNSVGPAIMQLGTDEQRDVSCRPSCGGRSTSPSATRSRGPGPTWPRSRPGPCATATST